MFAKLTPFLLLLFTITGPAWAQVELRVELIPKEEFFSTKKEDFDLIKNCDLSLTVINKTTDAIEIPKGYWPKLIRVCSSGSIGTRIPLVLGRRKDTSHEKALMKLDPGKEHRVLRVDAVTTLLSPGDQYTTDPDEFETPRWVWNWGARLGPDYSPFESRKGDERTDQAVLWAEIDMDGQTIRSVPIRVTREKIVDKN